jgi:hypothetical protein
VRVVVVFVVVVFERIEERIDVGLLATDQPEHGVTGLLVVVEVAGFDRVAIDTDVVAVVVDGSDDGELDLRIGGLVTEQVEEFAYEHGPMLGT